jgi:two-component system sensor histidine kinase BaeS
MIVAVVLLMQWSIGLGMVNFVNAKEIKALEPLVVNLAHRYEKTASWSALNIDDESFLRLVESQLMNSDFLPVEPDRGMQRGPKPPPHEAMLMQAHRPPPGHIAHYALLNKDKKRVVGKQYADLIYINTPIKLNNEIIGYLSVSKREHLADGYELDFLKQQTNYLWVIAFIAVLLTLLIAFLLARHLVGPVKSIATGMNKLKKGDYNTALTLDRKDELGQLSEDFNTLALTLERNEQVRKRWLANISHELRTPMSILLGELEAMLLGIREANKQNISSANDEALHLKRLIDDLHMLNSAELGGMHYSMQPLNMTNIFDVITQKYQVLFQQHAIVFCVVNVADDVFINADKTRILQLFDNILMNAVHYAQCSEISLSACNLAIKGKTFLEITLEDNGVGVTKEHLPHLFEYLYRVDSSRNRQQGGSGLGLSICHHIVSGHNGEITAQVSKLGGLGFVIRLPII